MTAELSPARPSGIYSGSEALVIMTSFWGGETLLRCPYWVTGGGGKQITTPLTHHSSISRFGMFFSRQEKVGTLEGNAQFCLKTCFFCKKLVAVENFLPVLLSDSRNGCVLPAMTHPRSEVHSTCQD